MKIASKKLLVILAVVLPVSMARGAYALSTPGSGGAGLPMVFPALQGASNTFYGSNAGNVLGANDAQRDTFLGTSAGYSNNTSGVDNTFVGYSAGVSNGGGS